jgi:hypothetical protein
VESDRVDDGAGGGRANVWADGGFRGRCEKVLKEAPHELALEPRGRESAVQQVTAKVLDARGVGP